MSTPTKEELEAYSKAYGQNIDSSVEGNPAMVAGLAAAFEVHDADQLTPKEARRVLYVVAYPWRGWFTRYRKGDTALETLAKIARKKS